MEIRDIVKDWLEDNEYSGLILDGECACTVEDLMHCENPCLDCEAGYVTPAVVDGETGYRVSRTFPQTTEGRE